jgi:hypothetical protein
MPQSFPKLAKSGIYGGAGPWIGTERGVSQLHAGAFVQDAIIDRLRHEKVWAIHEDPEGGLWFGTRGAGLFRWKAENITVYTTAQGLASNSIFHIIEHHNGKFWMSGPNGISSLRRKSRSPLPSALRNRQRGALWRASRLPPCRTHNARAPVGFTRCFSRRATRGDIHTGPDQ